MDRIEKILEKFNISGFVTQSVSLANLTTFKIGGVARYFAEPSTIDECIRLFTAIRENDLPFFVLGGGSNVVMPDDGVDGVIVSTRRLNGITAVAGTHLVQADAGVTVSDFTSWILDHQYGGFGFLGGLPGTVGGGVFMNARCYGHEFADIIESVTVLNISSGTVENVAFDASNWSYKKSPFQNGDSLILAVRFYAVLATQAELADERAEIERNIADRREKGHFSYPSAGSVFKNNRDFGKPSGALVDESGGKGMTEGGVRVAPWHGNFIINDGTGTAADVQNLVHRVTTLVQEKTGCTLECEIIFVPHTPNGVFTNK